ncbi:hypothetical protein NUU61_001346 [Penicillium alfredii]|uniref:Uncharacterized protein n=1 Tax=Penicillium alfredii TaxID=1506179 RepID=A0A9W9G3Y7_9EURO|nr:uncharacterized protein NUU61_001346 [Penicillium alfredii]KAJ5111716.1 hypothetical protein NUU61_001346 [Penicillium alfredii]
MPYHPSLPLSPELATHCNAFIEEKLYTQALNLLLSTVQSGIIIPTSPIITPPPSYLALAATILVHPSTTAHALPLSDNEAASAALRLLRLVHAVVGPRAAQFSLAFSFPISKPPVKIAVNDSSPWTKPLGVDLCGSASVWSRAEDFWHAVGWAFNCSLLHPERWERWLLWIELMCDALDNDWMQCTLEFAEAEQSREKLREVPNTPGTGLHGKKVNKRNETFSNSIIFRYISTTAARANIRRILRAIFADGSEASVREFREVFHQESRRIGHCSGSRKREYRVNLDQSGFYDSVPERGMREPSDAADPGHLRFPKRAKLRMVGSDSSCEATDERMASLNHHSDLAVLGGHKSISLRLRLLGVLFMVSEQLSQEFIPLEELDYHFVERVLHLPFLIFQAFINLREYPKFSPMARISLYKVFLYQLRESRAPDPENGEEGHLPQADIERCFLPFAAATADVVDNAKMSILLESLMLLLAGQDMLTSTPPLKEAVQAGIIAREKKTQNQADRAHEDLHSVGQCWLRESGTKLLLIVDLL